MARLTIRPQRLLFMHFASFIEYYKIFIKEFFLIYVVYGWIIHLTGGSFRF